MPGIHGSTHLNFGFLMLERYPGILHYISHFTRKKKDKSRFSRYPLRFELTGVRESSCHGHSPAVVRRAVVPRSRRRGGRRTGPRGLPRWPGARRGWARRFSEGQRISGQISTPCRKRTAAPCLRSISWNLRLPGMGRFREGKDHSLPDQPSRCRRRCRPCACRG